jgi:hypothetical protein
MPDTERQWDDRLERAVIERKAVGDSNADVAARLVHTGMSLHEANELVAKVVAERFKNYDKLFRRLRKTENLLDIHRQLRRLGENPGQVPEQDSSMSGSVFLASYYSRNTPVVLRGLINRWPATHKWCPEYFRNFGDRMVEVMTGRTGDPRFEVNRDEHKATMLMGEYLDLISSSGRTNDIYMVAHNYALRETFKDLCEDMLPIPGILRPPEAGWMNLWFGPEGTMTPLHHDSTNILLTQVYGSKRVTLIPSLEIYLLYNNISSYSEVNPADIQPEYPQATKATISVVELNQGDALFLPVGWWHTVESLSVSISVSCANFVHPNSYVVYNP